MFTTLTDPLVSIVTPTYNQAVFLTETIDSVLAQTYPHVDYIVLDDGSTDETPAILESYKSEDRLTTDRHDNIGQTATINKGWAGSHGEIIAWLNSDDLLTKEAVYQAVEALQANPTALMVHGNCDNVDEAGNFIGNYPSSQENLQSLLSFENSIGIGQPSTFLRRNVLNTVGFLDPLVYWCMDFDYWLRVALKGEIKYVNGSAWSKFRVHSDAKTSSQFVRSALDFIYVHRKIMAYGGRPKAISQNRRGVIAHGHWLAARKYLYGEHRKEARQQAWTSLLLAPTDHFTSKVKLLCGRS